MANLGYIISMSILAITGLIPGFRKATISQAEAMRF